MVLTISSKNKLKKFAIVLILLSLLALFIVGILMIGGLGIPQEPKTGINFIIIVYISVFCLILPIINY
jgi:type IV secretory pathway TrbL component